ncbi:hypothetical protein MLD38_033468 [Melastoma candidum]|uniref:Uncharacterized protein n=1 Tax=Melastoma candidum TaxID=119954 RepID=A0ACB9M8P6_9MYRT|nr:hypothetical protein MLD38_033468 [Melastoma candidum]
MSRERVREGIGGVIGTLLDRDGDSDREVLGLWTLDFAWEFVIEEQWSQGHKCNRHCENEHVCGNMYRCKLTGLTHICDKNCNQRILYDNHSSLCLASGKLFPLTMTEEQAVRGVRRRLDAENSATDSCAFKRRRDAQYHPSPFERSFSAVSPICSQVGDGMDMS